MRKADDDNDINNRPLKIKHLHTSVARRLSGSESPRTVTSPIIIDKSPIAITKKTASPGKEPNKPQKYVCKCSKTRCLKLYCVCFQNGSLCGPSCSCISCCNTKSEINGLLKKAKKEILIRNPNAFVPKVKESKSTSSGCSCRTNR